MTERSAARTRDRLARIYGAGIVGFIAIFGFLTVLFYFLDNLK